MVTEESKRLYFKIFHINPIRANITYKGVPNINEKLYVKFHYNILFIKKNYYYLLFLFIIILLFLLLFILFKKIILYIIFL